MNQDNTNDTLNFFAAILVLSFNSYKAVSELVTEDKTHITGLTMSGPDILMPNKFVTFLKKQGQGNQGQPIRVIWERNCKKPEEKGRNRKHLKTREETGRNGKFLKVH